MEEGHFSMMWEKAVRPGVLRENSNPFQYLLKAHIKAQASYWLKPSNILSLGHFLGKDL